MSKGVLGGLENWMQVKHLLLAGCHLLQLCCPQLTASGNTHFVLGLMLNRLSLPIVLTLAAAKAYAYALLFILSPVLAEFLLQGVTPF